MLPLHPHDPPSVGPYRLHRRLGEEAFTRVYLGSRGDGVPVAVKVARSEHATDPDFRSAFAQRVVSALDATGPHVCAVWNADLEGAVPWVAVARPLGPSLAELVREHGPLPADALAPLALALAQGLADLHASGRAHGSLWPDGVLLTPDSAVLADPGLEWLARDGAERAPHPAFAAPEGGAGPAADVLSWAATLCFAASGVEGPRGLHRIPLQLRGLVDACLKRHPALRPSAADVVRMLGGPGDPEPWPSAVRAAVEATAARQRSALASGGEGARGSGRRDGDGGADGARARRRRGRVLAAVGLVLALVAGSAAAWAYDWPPDAPAGEGGGNDAGGGGAGGLVTDAGCLGGSGYPAPGPEPDGAEARPIGLAFSPDGDALAVTDQEYGLMVWDWRAREEIARPSDTVGYASDPVFAPTGCAVAASVPVEYEAIDGTVSVAHTFDLPSGTTTRHLGPQVGPEETGGVWSARPRDALDIAFGPDGRLLAVAVTADLDGDSVGLVDLATGEAAGSLAPGRVAEMEFAGPDLLATVQSGAVSVWDVRTGEEPYTVRGVVSSQFAVVPGREELVHEDRRGLVRVDYTTRAESGSYAPAGLPGDASLVDIAVGRGRVYATWTSFSGAEGVNRAVSRVWDLETGEDLVDRDGAPDFRRIAVHPEGEVLAAVTADGRVVLVDPETLEPGDPLF
ncbi:protein kinase family protein [Nocardiopsis sp. NPDC050513]|uniref:protein kinase family protein n=1 Tax=Nocardiopsis sp. NPDC050513 TaxID=3364338 RepID=UPI0037A87616